jgi:hypothetical protein
LKKIEDGLIMKFYEQISDLCIKDKDFYNKEKTNKYKLMEILLLHKEKFLNNKKGLYIDYAVKKCQNLIKDLEEQNLSISNISDKNNIILMPESTERIQTLFTFLKEISQIFCSFYFINQKVQDFINPYMNQCQNCYQCILTLLLSCKKEKVEELFLGTYKEYFEIVYEKYIYENVNYIIKKHYDLLYEKNIRKNLSEEDIEEIVSEIRINMMEYFCHCNLFYKDEYKNFF